MDSCLSKYIEIETKSDVSLMRFYLLLILGTFLLISEFVLIISVSYLTFVWIVPLFENFPLINKYPISVDNVLQYVAFFIAILGAYFPFKYSENIKSIGNKIQNNNILKLYSEAKWDYLGSVVFSFIQIFVLFPFFLEGDAIYKLISFTILLVFALVMVNSINYKKSLTEKVKFIINNSFSEHFPHLKITTMGGEPHKGKIKNIFNHDSIVLVDNDTETVILWDAVASITEIKEKHE